VSYRLLLPPTQPPLPLIPAQAGNHHERLIDGPRSAGGVSGMVGRFSSSPEVTHPQGLDFRRSGLVFRIFNLPFFMWMSRAPVLVSSTASSNGT